MVASGIVDNNGASEMNVEVVKDKDGDDESDKAGIDCDPDVDNAANAVVAIVGFMTGDEDGGEGEGVREGVILLDEEDKFIDIVFLP